MREVGAFEAKTTLGTLLDLVQGGEEVVITRHGKRVARLVPERPKHDVEAAMEAVRRMEALRAGIKQPLTVEEIISFRDEGRR